MSVSGSNDVVRSGSGWSGRPVTFHIPDLTDGRQNAIWHGGNFDQDIGGGAEEIDEVVALVESGHAARLAQGQVGRPPDK